MTNETVQAAQKVPGAPKVPGGKSDYQGAVHHKQKQMMEGYMKELEVAAANNEAKAAITIFLNALIRKPAKINRPKK